MTSSSSHPIALDLGALWRRGRVIAADIKLAHSVFALPFALLAAFLAAGAAGRLPGVAEIALVVACMVLARTAAMTFNRWADAALDAANPRTRNRAIPGGRVPPAAMLAASAACAAGLVAGAGGFWALNGNPWPLVASPAVIAWLLAYSFTKRFTRLCHLVLGVALALSPVAAALALAPGSLARADIWLLAVMVACWVAGFDVLYALQDVGVDRETGLRSLPADAGIGAALWASRGLHAVAFGALLAIAIASPLLGAGFATGTGLVGLLLAIEHLLVRGGSTDRLTAAFFTVNGSISLLLGALGIADVVRALIGSSAGLA